MRFKNRAIVNMNMRRAALLLSLCAVVAFATACGGGKPPEATPTPVPTASPAPVQTVKIVTVKPDVEELNVRSAGTTDGDILGTADGGDSFLLKKESTPEGWHEIDYKGQTGFVSAEYTAVSETQQSALATATPEAGATATPEATDAPAATATPEAVATPDPDAPIRVNSGEREKESGTEESGITPETIRDKEDPARH